MVLIRDAVYLWCSPSRVGPNSGRAERGVMKLKHEA